MSTTIKAVHTVGIGVRDQERALEFYVDVLGFEKRLDAWIDESTRWVEVAPRGVGPSLALMVTEREVDEVVDTGIRYLVPDADAEHASMAGTGVVVGDVIRWEDVPTMFSFDDPDGNRFYVVEEMR